MGNIHLGDSDHPQQMIPRSIVKGLVAGLVGRVLATWTMTQFQNRLSRVGQHEQGGSRNDGPSSEEQAHSESESESESEVEAESQSEPATVKAAAAISDRVFHH